MIYQGEALIVSKTKMKGAYCVGALFLELDTNIRLLNPGNQNQPLDTEFEVGQIWKIKFIPRKSVFPPHTEDVIILEKKRVSYIFEMKKFLLSRNINIIKDSIENLFDGLLEWTSTGKGYLPENKIIPNYSVAFWIPDQPLYFYLDYNKPRYKYGYTNKSLPFVGLQEIKNILSAGSLLRVSLSRGFDKDNTGLKSFWLQLSGWYD